MTQSFKARQMVPGKDTIRVMATHYGLKPSVVRDIIMKAGVKVVREDGFRGKLADLSRGDFVVAGLSPRLMSMKKIVGWEDGTIGVDPLTTKLTRKAITAVALWKFQQS